MQHAWERRGMHVVKSEGNKSVGSPRLRLEDNIKMDLREI
jgi:hypothetical protein